MKKPTANNPTAETTHPANTKRKFVWAIALVFAVFLGSSPFLLPSGKSQVSVTYTGKKEAAAYSKGFGEPLEDGFSISNSESHTILLAHFEVQVLTNNSWQPESAVNALALFPNWPTREIFAGEHHDGTIRWKKRPGKIEAIRLMVKFHRPLTEGKLVRFWLSQAWQKKSLRPMKGTGGVFDGQLYETTSPEWKP